MESFRSRNGDWSAVLFLDDQTATDFLDGYTGVVKFGVTLMQIPVLACRDSSKISEALSDIFSPQKCLVIPIDEDFPQIFVGESKYRWINRMKRGINLRELEQDLLTYSPIFKFFFDRKTNGINFEFELPDNEWNIIKLAFFIVKKKIIERPSQYPVTILFENRALMFPIFQKI